MKVFKKQPPRVYVVGQTQNIAIKDCATIKLEDNEQVTFVTASGAEYDVAKKKWGFYATPSLNGRLKSFDLRAALIKNKSNKYYVFLLEKNKEDALNEYLASEKQTLVCWLDEDVNLEKIFTLFSNTTHRVHQTS